MADKTTGGAIIARMLKQEGVEKFFGIIDGTYTHLFKNCVDMGMQMITPRHESIAAHMAGAYARLTGKLGVCLASSGPGVANVLSGACVENAEGNRVLLITSCRRTPVTYPDRGGAYQFFDQVGVIKAMSKWSCAVPSFDRIPELMRQALRACYDGRPGIVHIDVAENLMNGEGPEKAILKPHQYRRIEPLEPSPADVGRAAEMLASASLPIIHAGSGIIHAGAYAELAELAEMLQAPVTTSWAARGVLDERNPLSMCMIHIKAVNQVRNEADVVLCLGSRIGETDWWGKAPYWAPPDAQKLIQVDADEEAIGRTRQVDLGVVGDVKVFLQRLIGALKDRKVSLASRKEKISRVTGEAAADRAELDKKLQDSGSPMVTAHVGHICREVFPDDAVAVFDGGNAAVWANFYHQVRVPNTLLTTNHMGHLGAGVGQTLGACAARPDKKVYCITGDGAMGFHPQEIETAVRNRFKPVFLVAVDKQWGMVKINQSFALKFYKALWNFKVKGKPLEPEETYNTELCEIEWDLLARSMGAHGERVSDPAQLRPALERCLESDKCAVIHVDVDPFKHMMAPGLIYFKDMHQEPKGK
ncbi:MAG: thiamine pyrophosphate-binding protein [Desulfobacterota bacterium]|jgi:acetolactate synthase-1/2/3 large subunit|nr:thiamine pyrophosphate-binding protein [Thermodesulfobacteriota bacterium]